MNIPFVKFFVFGISVHIRLSAQSIDAKITVSNDKIYINGKEIAFFTRGKAVIDSVATVILHPTAEIPLTVLVNDLVTNAPVIVMPNQRATLFNATIIEVTIPVDLFCSIKLDVQRPQLLERK